MLLYRLDEVVDAHQITRTLLDVMPKCSKCVQQGILELLPELVLEEDCQVQPDLQTILGLLEGPYLCKPLMSACTLHASANTSPRCATVLWLFMASLVN